jgi:uncharacterized protein YjdB
MKKIAFTFLLAGLTLLSVQGQWSNPTTRNGEWSNYGTGDPYILKYRGVYYLYCSTKDNNDGFKCWSTKDFITWSDVYDGVSSPATALRGAYAPEVVYWNGKFYMYASSGQQSHYVLESDSPTGPFTRIASGLGRTIDGSIFIEDNGSWYFYYAGEQGIQGCAVTNQTTMTGGSGLNAKTGYGWTEGPTVIKRNGVYYLTYTGNHITSRGYRIDYAKNTAGPLASFTPQLNQNPILLNTEGPDYIASNPAVVTANTEHVGLGHGSMFTGPDLDTYYYVYHNLNARTSTGGHQRKVNFDRISWNGDKLMMHGPTTWTQQAFRLADMSDFFDRATLGSDWSTPNNGSWTIKNNDRLVQELSTGEYKVISSQSTEADYTAEFTVKEEPGNTGAVRFGAVFGYTDESNYGIAVLNSNPGNQLEIGFKQNGTWGASTFYSLPDGYSLSAWHTLRIIKSGTSYRFFIDGMQKATITNTLGGGKIGYMTSSCQAAFDYTAFSNSVNGSGMFDIYKPVPGIIASVHYNTGGEGVAYHDLTTGSTGEYRKDVVDMIACSEGGFAINSQAGEWYKYNVNVKTAGLYHLGLRYSSTGQAGVRIWHENTPLTDVILLPVTANNWWTYTIKNFDLPAGHQTLRIETVSGNVNLYEMRFAKSDASMTTLSDAFTSSFSSNWNYAEGTWSIASGAANINGYGKRTMGNTGWADYTVSVDITYRDRFNAGIIVRVNNPAMGGSGTDTSLGADYLQGYFIGLENNGVLLGKHNYNWTQLLKTEGAFVIGQKYGLKVEVQGSNIKAYVDNVLKLEYTDTSPFICGKVGLRVCDANVSFDNFSVKTNNTEYVPVAGMTLNKSDITLALGARDTLRAAIIPDNATIKTVAWTSSNSNVATLLNDTVITTGRAAGTAIITATSLEGGFTEHCTVTVVRVATGMTLDKSTLSLSVGESEQLTANLQPSNSTETIEWSSSDPGIVTVDKGLVMAISAGTATITAKTSYSELTDVCAVTVQNPAGTVERTPDAPPLPIYPNPTDGMFTLELGTAGERLVTISDVSGKILLRQPVKSSTAQIDIRHFPADVYLLTIDDGKGKNTLKIVKNQ